jgi:L-alanine-DL-glutamate epimerase-like enolase superfamily enzyme
VTDGVNISGLSAHRLSIPLKTGYAIAYASYDTADNVVVSVETRDGFVGWGCAAPDTEVTGETVEDTLGALRDELAPALERAGDSPAEELLRMVEEAAPAAPAARAAVDVALFDLWGHHQGVPVQTLLGGARCEIPTSITIGIMDVDATCESASESVAAGFSILKIKGGRDAEEDIERIRALRRRLGAPVALRLDVNQGYSVRQAVSVMDALAGEIEFIEQPVDADDVDGLAELAARSVLPVMADESVLGPDDAIEILERGIPLLCVKLMKSGGITAAARVCDVARQHGARVMIGCMDELPISMAAAAHLALSHPAVAFADLDGHLDMQQRVATGGLVINNGRVSVTTEPGLGVRVDRHHLEELAAGKAF